MAALSQPVDQRSRLYGRLMRRNRVVGLLRWLVPTAGAALLLVLVVTFLIDSIGQRFGFSNIRIDRDKLVVETPKLSSVDDDGTLYALSARAAKVASSEASMVDLEGSEFVITPLTGAAMTVKAEAGRFQMDDQLLEVPGIAEVSNTDGLDGTLEAVLADLLNRKMEATGAVNIRLPDGTVVVSHGMTYDQASGIYTFKRANVTLASTPGEAK